MKRTIITAILFAISASSVSAQQATYTVQGSTQQYSPARSGYQSYPTQASQGQLQRGYQQPTYVPQQGLTQQGTPQAYYYPHQQPVAGGVVGQPVQTAPRLQSVLQNGAQSTAAQPVQAHQGYLALPTKARPPAPSIPPQPEDLVSQPIQKVPQSVLNLQPSQELTTGQQLALPSEAGAPAPSIPTQAAEILVPAETAIVANQQESQGTLDVPAAPETNQADSIVGLVDTPKTSVVEETPQVTEDRAVEKLAITEAVAPTKELAVTEELSTTDELADVEPFRSTEEPADVDKLLATEELSDAEELMAAEELSDVEELVAAEELSDANELVAAEETLGAEELAVAEEKNEQLADAAMAEFGLSDEPTPPEPNQEELASKTAEAADSEPADAIASTATDDKAQIAQPRPLVSTQTEVASPITSTKRSTGSHRVASKKSAPVRSQRSSSYIPWLLGLIPILGVPILAWVAIRKKKQRALEARFAEAALHRVNTKKSATRLDQIAAKPIAKNSDVTQTATTEPGPAKLASIAAPVKQQAGQSQQLKEAPASLAAASPEGGSTGGILSMNDIKNVELSGSEFDAIGSADTKLNSPAEANSSADRVPKARAEVATIAIDNGIRDSFTSINGINDATQQALYKAGYVSFSDLAKASERELQLALSKSNQKFSHTDFERWTTQAAFASLGDWDSFVQQESAPTATAASVVDSATHAIKPATHADDLTKIRGIGPATAKLLQAAGITTFASLSNAGTPRLQEILNDGGEKFAVLDPSMWCRQAEFAINPVPTRPHVETIALNIEPKADPQLAPATTPVAEQPSAASASLADDLTKIAGIGPETQGLLRELGIKTFEQIGKMTSEQLNELLASQDTKFHGLDATTWPVQARALKTDLTEEASVLDQVNSIIDIARNSSPASTNSDVSVDAATKVTSEQ